MSGMKPKTYENFKLLASAALFLLLTALKLFLPEQSAAARQRVRAAVSRDYDYQEAFAQLGSRITGGGEVTAGGLTHSRPSARVANLRLPTPDALRDARLAPLPRGTSGDIAAARSAAQSTPAAQPEPEALPAAVAAFLQSQEPYADEAVPVNVSYEMPDLPFAFQSPVTGMTSSGFGFRLHPLLDAVKFHYGTDFAAWSGTDILCFADGTVAMTGWDKGYGNYIMVDHAGGWRTLYAHCQTVYVTGGDAVTMGQKLGLVGDTGEVTGPHLHFELTCGGIYYNPEFYLA